MVIALLLLMFASAVPQRGAGDPAEQERASKPPARGDVIVARGCLKGSALENATLGKPEGIEQFADLMTYRLTGEKKLLQALRKDHDGHADVITGELKTDLPTSAQTRGRRVGNTRIVIGVGPSRGMGQAPPPPIPVLRVTSFEHTGVTCR